MKHQVEQTAGAPQPGDALVIVDVQQDFLPGGALAVKGGDQVIGPLNRYLGDFQRLGLPVIATRDWHPPDHSSFREQGGNWPPHCIAAGGGAAFAPQLQLPRDVLVISKGVRRDAAGYSAFEHTDLAARLRERGCRRLLIGGLATDYCVQATARDALASGFQVVVLADAVQAVDLQPGDGSRSLANLVAAGARLGHLGDIPA